MADSSSKCLTPACRCRAMVRQLQLVSGFSTWNSAPDKMTSLSAKSSAIRLRSNACYQRSIIFAQERSELVTAEADRTKQIARTATPIIHGHKNLLLWIQSFTLNCNTEFGGNVTGGYDLLRIKYRSAMRAQFQRRVGCMAAGGIRRRWSMVSRGSANLGGFLRQHGHEPVRRWLSAERRRPGRNPSPANISLAGTSAGPGKLVISAWLRRGGRVGLAVCT